MAFEQEDGGAVQDIEIHLMLMLQQKISKKHQTNSLQMQKVF